MTQKHTRDAQQSLNEINLGTNRHCSTEPHQILFANRKYAHISTWQTDFVYDIWLILNRHSKFTLVVETVWALQEMTANFFVWCALTWQHTTFSHPLSSIDVTTVSTREIWTMINPGLYGTVRDVGFGVLWVAKASASTIKICEKPSLCISLRMQNVK